MSDLISRQQAIKATWQDTGYTDPFNVMTAIRDRIKQLPTIQPNIGKWIPVTERLPKEEGFYIVTLEHRYGAETTVRFFKIENGESYWSVWGNENITAWMPKPEPYKGVTT